MFSRKKEVKSQARSTEAASNEGKKRQLGQMGLLDVPDINSLGNLRDLLSGSGISDEEEDDDNGDLEAELMALQAGEDTRRVVSRKRLEESILPKQERRIHNEADDEDEDVDENDPELLAELNRISHPAHSASVRPCPPVSKHVLHIGPQPMAAAPCQSMPLPTQQLPAKMISSMPHQTIQQSLEKSLNQNAPPENCDGQSLVGLLQERILNYKSAQENAKAAGESAKVRRLDRGLKTLETMLKTAKAGKPVIEEDIPPTVALGAKPKVDSSENDTSGLENAFPSAKPSSLSTEAAPNPSNESKSPIVSPTPPPLPPRMKSSPSIRNCITGDCNTTMNVLTTRRGQYRQAALSAKRENNDAKALEYVKIAKKFDLVIAALERGQEVDLQAMPPPLPVMEDGHHPFSSHIQLQSTPLDGLQNSSSVFSTPQGTAIPLDIEQSLPFTDEPEDPSLFRAPPPPTSVLEALQQRLAKYQTTFQEATSSGNSSKARRMGRIVKQYEDAIKLCKAGKQIPYDDLPTPPGFAPIPVDNSFPTVPRNSKPDLAGIPEPTKPVSTSGAPTAHQQQVPFGPTMVSPSAATSLPSKATQVSNKPAQKAPQSLHEKQLAAILERQKLFKVAALEAKKRNDLQAAKEYLRLAKGFEPMINASKCGLPVNMDSLPLPPQFNESSFEIVNLEDCFPVGDNEELYNKLEKELQTQIEMCSRNRMHFSKLGDVQNTQKFETMLQNTKKDLDFVKHCKKRGDPLPRFHYETRTFSIVRCCTDLGDDDLELTIIKGINYTCSNPNEVDTYVKYEFPFPSEAMPKDKTRTVRDTNNPEYDAVFKIAISRKSRSCINIIKRKGIKLEVWAKGGFLRSDVLLGTAVVKLQPLETRCILHDSFDLLEGRKPTGGKLEIKVRIREPILTKQIETHCEKWLIVDGSKTTRI